MPANYLHVTTGLTLEQLQSVQGATFNPRALFTLLFVAVLALIPTFFRKNIEKLDEKMGAGVGVKANEEKDKLN